MYRLYNSQTERYLVDEYNEIIEFFNGYTIIEYYELYCENMINIVIIKLDL